MDKTTKALAAALDFRQMRQKVIASNIANAKTPGYQAKRLDFEAALARALDIDGLREMRVNNPRHFDVGNGGFDNLEPSIYDDPNGIINENGNTVNADDEMARMAENKIMYDATVQLLNRKLALKSYLATSER